jgi:hypothetical protein
LPKAEEEIVRIKIYGRIDLDLSMLSEGKSKMPISIHVDKDYEQMKDEKPLMSKTLNANTKSTFKNDNKHKT